MQARPKVLWDGAGLQSLYSGVGHHAFHLASSCGSYGVNPLVLASSPLSKASWPQQVTPQNPRHGSLARLKPLALRRSAQLLREFLTAHSGEAYVLHGLSNYNLPDISALQRPRVRTVLTVHDLIPILAPRSVSSFLAAYLRWQMPRALARADVIIAVSRWTQQTLEDLYPATRNRIMLIPNGIVRQELIATEAKKARPGQVLTIARGEDYKQLHLIPAILAKLPPEFSWNLVTDARGLERMQRLGFAGEASSRLQVRVAVDPEDLRRLEDEAAVYVHPSLWEGYCLPAASALARAQPVIYLQGSGIDEVVGAGGIGLQRHDLPADWAAAIQTVTKNYEIWTRRAEAQSLQLLGWDQVALQTLTLYGILV